MRASFKYSFSLIFILSGNVTAQDIRHYIISGYADSIGYFLDQGHDINGVYSDYTLLEMSMAENQKNIVRYLLGRHADVNRINHGNPPLFYAIYFSQRFADPEMIKIMLDSGADIDVKGRAGATPLIYACRSNNSDAAKLLYERGADASVRDDHGFDFYYFVLHGNDPGLIKYFEGKGFRIPRPASVTEGPYLKHPGGNAWQAIYFSYDSLSDSIRFIHTSAAYTIKRVKFSTPLSSNSQVVYLNADSSENSEYSGVSKIFAIGDLHGDYQTFVRLLRANKITDNKLKWIWGNGHLVLCGDVFDRGRQVTECLWLIYKLENQAFRKGGRVHYILGNHEVMNLLDENKYYVNDKYILLCAKLGIDYQSLFGRDFELGKWLRTKNTVVKINDLLFVHGGIPPEFPSMNQTLDRINNTVRAYLTGIPDTINEVRYRFAIQPLWYRSYFEKKDLFAELDPVLQYYKIGHIIVGHTPVREIRTLQGGKVIALNVPFDEAGINAAALLVVNNKFFTADAEGKITALQMPVK